MEFHISMMSQKLPHRRRLVNTQIVENDVHFLIGWATGDHVFQKPHELGAGMARGSLAHDVAGLRIERGEQRQRTMAMVLKPVAFGPPWRQRQPPVLAIQGLRYASNLRVQLVVLG